MKSSGMMWYDVVWYGMLLNIQYGVIHYFAM